MKNKIIKITLASATGFSGFMALGWSFFKLIVRYRKGEKQEVKRKWHSFAHMKVNHPRYKFEKEYETGKAWCREQPMQDYFMISHDGLRLHAYYLPAKNARRFVLLSHGYKGSGFGDFAYTARFLHENGCNLLFIDQRCCGMSEGTYITFGAREQFDVQGWADYISDRNYQRLPIYLYGESMGAAAVLMSLKHPLPPEVKGVISDCGFCSMRNQLQKISLDWFHLHWIELLLFRIDLFCRIFGGFRMKDADTTEALQINRIPILFFHGMKDTYVNPSNTMHNYEICRAPKELILIPEARHLCSAYEEKDLYRSKLLEFFAKYDGRTDYHTL